MKKVRVYTRLFLLFLSLPPVVLFFLLSYYISGGNVERAIRYRMKYARFILWVLGVEIEHEVILPDEPVLFVANHRSWLDPVLTHFAPKMVVAKAEVGKWPLIGLGCRLCGAIYVQRDKKSSRKKTLFEILKKWQEGQSVLVYAEGTTCSLPTTKDFRPGGFRLAAEYNIPIVPIAIEYQNQSDHWVGSDLFLPHVVRSFGKKKTKVKVRYGKAIKENDPEILMQKTKAWIDNQLIDMRENWFIENPNQESIKTA